MTPINPNISLSDLAAMLKARYEHSAAALMPLLYEVQARDGYISEAAELEVAEALQISPREVHAAVSFYPLLLKKPEGKHLIQFCHNICCSLLGAESLVEVLERELGVGEKEPTSDGLFSWRRVECLGCCADAPVMLVGEKLYTRLTPEKVKRVLDSYREGKIPDDGEPLTETNELDDPAVSVNFKVPNATDIKVAEARGAYKALRKALTEMTPDQIQATVKSAGLRGQGGAGFPTGVKWGFIPKDPALKKYLCVNGDESEPGTCKDREIMRRDPHRLIEGIVIAARAIGSDTAYVYIRREFYEPAHILDKAIQQAYEAGYLGENILGSGFNLHIYTHPGAGAYICGEETGLINSLEGKKGWPRIKPPFPAIKGLFGYPTIVNNIETLSNVPYIINNGADAFRRRGTEKSPGTKLFSVSGHIKRPGVYELPMGINLREVIYGVAGGIRDGHTLKAVIPGGSSVPVLNADEIDVGLDFESMNTKGTFLGSGGIIVMDETVDIPWALEIISRFYAHESCGQCTPCREGTKWIHKILHRVNNDLAHKRDLVYMLDIANGMDGQTICPFGSAAAWPVQAILKKFPEEFEKRCH
jgi:NADH-quinone oxidoreductase F subunit